MNNEKIINRVVKNELVYKDGYKHQVQELFVHPIDLGDEPIIEDFYRYENRLLYIYKGYTWDGASGPTMDNSKCKIPSLVHDVLYQMMRLGQLDRSYREYADRLFYEMLINENFWQPRAWVWYKFVRKFSEKYTRKPKNTIRIPCIGHPYRHE